MQIISGALLVGLFSLLWMSEDPFVTGILMGYVMSGVYVLLVSYLHKRGFMNHFMKVYREGEHKTVLGEHVMTIVDSGLVDKTAGGESLTYWSSIGPIVREADYTLVYTGSATAHVIPAASVKEGDYNQFVDSLMQRHQAATGANPSSTQG